MLLRVIILLTVACHQSIFADFNMNKTADVTRKNKTDVSTVGDGVLEMSTYNDHALKTYYALKLTEKNGGQYIDNKCKDKTPRQVVYREGKNIVCFRYQTCTKNLYFCKQRLNLITGENQEIRARQWLPAWE
jgi:hypothetical protein